MNGTLRVELATDGYHVGEMMNAEDRFHRVNVLPFRNLARARIALEVRRSALEQLGWNMTIVEGVVLA